MFSGRGHAATLSWQIQLDRTGELRRFIDLARDSFLATTLGS
jgi:hypothetical protein